MSILVGTSSSPHSLVAVSFAAYLAQATERDLTLLSVSKKEEKRPEAESALESSRFVLAPFDQRATSKVRIGHPAEEIVAEAEEGGYSIIVVGEKQHQGLLTRFSLGSTAQRVVEHAPVPVVVVKGVIGAVRNLLICDSGSPDSVVKHFAEQLPRLLEKVESITVLHVMSQMSAGPGVDGHILRADTEQLIAEKTVEGMLMRRDMAALDEYDYPIVPKVRHGRIVDEVLAEARDGQYDLVVVGAHRGTGWRRILLDDITHQLIVAIDRPVLVVR